MITVYGHHNGNRPTATKHELGWDWVIENGNLIIRSKTGDPIVTYAAGAWLKVEDNDPIEVSA